MSTHPRSEEFARGLSEFLSLALPLDDPITMIQVDDGIRIGAGPVGAAGFKPISLGEGVNGPLLRVEYKLADHPSGRYFKVLSSTFGLLVPLDRKSKSSSEVPVIRVEFERSQSPPAHVHFHTASQTLGWLYGNAGGNYRRAEELHFPVGSQRFRPTIEEFLMFLDKERLFRGWRPHSDWRTSARSRIEEYERRQAVATVRHHPEAIAAELETLGWTVSAPA